MTDVPQERPESATPPPIGPSWTRILALLSVMGASFAWLVANWPSVEPVIQSPPMVLIALLSTYGLGGLSAYWLVARPLEQRLKATEETIRRLRADERMIRDQMAELREKIARFETKLQILEKAPAKRPPRTPKS